MQEARLISGDLRRRTLAACERPPAPEELARSVARWQAATDEEGGVDGGEEGSSRVLTPRAPSKGSAVIFSSGWENLHQVEPLRSGTRLAIPAFFTTCPVPPELLEPPADDAAIARSLHSGLLEPEDVGAFRSFMMNWHSLLAPGHD